MMKRSLLFVLALLSITAIQAQTPNWMAELTVVQVAGAPANEYHFDLFINAQTGTDDIYLNTSGFVLNFDPTAFTATPALTLAGTPFANECTLTPAAGAAAAPFVQFAYHSNTSTDVNVALSLLTIDINTIGVNSTADLQSNVGLVDDTPLLHKVGRFILSNWDNVTDPTLTFEFGGLIKTIIQANNQLDLVSPHAIEEVPVAGGTLPVEFINFTAEKSDNFNVELNWSTAVEINNDRFVIEKKRNDGEFFEIGDVKGAGTTSFTQSYNFLDKTAMSEVVSYRLKQIDIDGTFEYSDIVEVSFDFTGENLYLVYPNPVQDLLFLETATNADQVSSYVIMDVQGKTLMQGNIEAGQATAEVNVNDLAEGVYMVRIKNELGQAQITRFVKL